MGKLYNPDGTPRSCPDHPQAECVKDGPIVRCQVCRRQLADLTGATFSVESRGPTIAVTKLPEN